MEHVVLVDEQDQELGIADKDIIHTQNTPLHRGFSLFLFNLQKQLLLTQRSVSKKTFPGIWTNTVCGHPQLKEKVEDAAMRRLQVELGIGQTEIRLVSAYRYKFADQQGIVENEICPILVGLCNQQPQINPQEVTQYKWTAWSDFLTEIKKRPQVYSPWCIEEGIILKRKVNWQDFSQSLK